MNHTSSEEARARVNLKQTMNLKSILAATDLSAWENIAVQRARQLADTHRASVKLMYMPARGQPVLPTAASRLANAAKRLEDSRGPRVRTAPVKSDQLEDLVIEARGADLVVLPDRHERSIAAFSRGQPALRLSRQCGRPVLVVRQAHTARYARVLGAVNFSAARVLSWGSSDVLLLPDAYLQDTALLAARRAAKVVGNKPALPLRPVGRRS